MSSYHLMALLLGSQRRRSLRGQEFVDEVEVSVSIKKICAPSSNGSTGD